MKRWSWVILGSLPWAIAAARVRPEEYHSTQFLYLSAALSVGIGSIMKPSTVLPILPSFVGYAGFILAFSQWPHVTGQAYEARCFMFINSVGTIPFALLVLFAVNFVIWLARRLRRSRRS